MDSWKYLSEQKGLFVSEELDCFPFYGSGNGSCNRNNSKVVIGNEMKPIYSVENYTPLVSNAQAFDGLGLMEMGFSDEIRKPMYSVSGEPSGDVFSTGTGTDSCGNVAASPFCDQDKDSGCRVFNDYVQSKNRGLSVVDLKLGGLVDGNVSASSDVMSHTVKRVRPGTSLYPRIPCCQVFGCNKDLSSYKGYYKRHKVCDVHTKTAKVIIEGIEQRFCQQCSRFHLLAEFDDGKRSCRRRLAAHNKRRRKPQHASKSGSRIIGFSSSFAFPDMLLSSDMNSGGSMGNIVNGMKTDILDLESFSSMQQSSSALSLLSHNMPTQLRGAAITSPLINKSNQTNSEKIAQSGFHTPGMYLVGANHVNPALINHYEDANSTVDLKFRDDGISMGPYLRNISNNNNDDDNIDYHNNPLGRGIILDLLQLSSHLQRIEHQKHSTESEAG